MKFIFGISCKCRRMLITGCNLHETIRRHSFNEYRAPFYLHGLTLIPEWISNHMPGKVCAEITYPFLNFNGCTVEV